MSVLCETELLLKKCTGWLLLYRIRADSRKQVSAKAVDQPLELSSSTGVWLTLRQMNRQKGPLWEEPGQLPKSTPKVLVQWQFVTDKECFSPRCDTLKQAFCYIRLHAKEKCHRLKFSELESWGKLIVALCFSLYSSPSLFYIPQFWSSFHQKCSWWIHFVVKKL